MTKKVITVMLSLFAFGASASSLGQHAVGDGGRSLNQPPSIRRLRKDEEMSCSNGVEGIHSKDGKFCCAEECGRCGGHGCYNRGGDNICCTKQIGNLCTEAGEAPCIIDDGSDPTSPASIGDDDSMESAIPSTPSPIDDGVSMDAANPSTPADDDSRSFMTFPPESSGLDDDFSSSNLEHLGCFNYADLPDIVPEEYVCGGQRVEWCMEYCTDPERDAQFMALQFGYKCWCPDAAEIEAYEQRDADQCQQACYGTGTIGCGGDSCLDLYEIK